MRTPNEEPNPYDHTQDTYEFCADIYGLWKWFKRRRLEKLRDKLKASRDKYREALGKG